MSRTLLGAIDVRLADNGIRHFFGLIPKREELTDATPTFVAYLHTAEKAEFQGHEIISGKVNLCRIYEDNTFQFQCYGLSLEIAELLRDMLEDVLDGWIPTLDLKNASPFRRDDGFVRISGELSSEAEFVYLASVNYYVRTEYTLVNGVRVKP